MEPLNREFLDRFFKIINNLVIIFIIIKVIKKIKVIRKKVKD